MRIRMWFRIQVLDDQKVKKKLLAETLIYFYIKNCNSSIYLGLPKLQKPAALKRELPALQNLNSINFFYFWITLALPDLDPDLHLQSQCGSGSSRPK
jgi:hypothetical protein